MKRALVFAPHPDDETLGVGGTIAKMASYGHEVTVVTVSQHSPPLYTAEHSQRTVREARAAHEVLGVKKSVFLGHAALSLADIPEPELNRQIEIHVRTVEPDFVFTPFVDRHSDHRLVFNAVMVATRPIPRERPIPLVAAYETISSTHWNAPNIEANFAPDLHVDITDQMELKLKAMSSYESQLQDNPGPRSIQALVALAMFRGSQAGFSFGESFQTIRMTGDAIL